MKTLGFCLLILSLSVLHLKAQMDYTAPATTWTGAACQRSRSAEGIFQSPLNLLSDKCAPYEGFAMDLPSVSETFNFDYTTYGAFTATPGTAGSFSVNGRSWTTGRILIRIPTEHQLPNQNHANSLEVQIELTPAASNPDTKKGMLSFLFYTSALGQGYVNSLNAINIVTTFSNSDTPSVTLRLDTLTQKIKEKVSTGLYLNFFSYLGTKTDKTCEEVIWYVYGSPLTIQGGAATNVLNNAQSAQQTAGTNAAAIAAGFQLTTDDGNNRPIKVDGGGFGSLAAVRLCYTGYFKNYMNYNYGLWFGVVIIVGWFIVNLTLSEKPIKDTEYQETAWTNHPLYSLYHVGNDLFTRKTRMSLLLGTITIHALFSSVWYRRTSEKHRTDGSNIIVYAIYSMLVDWAFIFILGSMLRGYYIAKHQYYKTKEEAWQQKSQNRIFAFYFCVFLLACVLWPFCVWNMGELHPEKDDEPSNYWVASFFVGLALELLIVDPIICLLAKSITPLRNLIKHRGYMYDNICHETYLDHLKVD